jgi:hypothetical protein
MAHTSRYRHQPRGIHQEWRCSARRMGQRDAGAGQTGANLRQRHPHFQCVGLLARHRRCLALCRDPPAVRCRTQYCNPRWTGHLGHCRARRSSHSASFASVCRRSAERCCSSLTLRLVSCFCFSLAASSSFVLRKFLSAVTASLACFFFNSESFQPSKSGKDVCSAKDRAMIVKTLISGTCPHTCPILLELALGPESNRR